MQKYYDYHSHASFSYDAHISIEQTCSMAIASGAAGLTFTEHLTLADDPTRDMKPDPAAYAAEIKRARAVFPQLELGMGLELDLNPVRTADLDELTQNSAWDFVLGSVHELYGCNLTGYDGGFSATHSVKKSYHNYFCGLYERVLAMTCFDVLGHLDLLRRDSRFTKQPFAYADHAEVLDAILYLLIRRGQGLEVNTAAWRYGVAEAHPGMQVLRRYRQLGGEVLTCGSDCHSPAAVFYRIPEGYAMIKEAGFKYISLFENRKPKQLKLEI